MISFLERTKNNDWEDRRNTFTNTEDICHDIEKTDFYDGTKIISL